MQELLKFLLHETFSYVPAQEWANIWIARDSLFNQSVGLLGPVMEGGEKGPFWIWYGAMTGNNVFRALVDLVRSHLVCFGQLVVRTLSLAGLSASHRGCLSSHVSNLPMD